MAEESSNTNINPYQKQENKDELKKHLVSFGLMILFTVVAFAVVIADIMDKTYAILFLIVLAIVQVAFQFYYFMHLKDKDHAPAAVLIYGGMWAAALALAGLGLSTWW
ncbi:MAG TPA: cytochrome C oxidase subunit IV family protein [Virgibacillus sp.]|nr:cytochrome C oxidase subunit IV family protein [Virgibacillus sp.]